MTVHVKVDARYFLVDFDAQGAPVRIKERKVHMPGHPYLETLFNAPYWSAAHHKLGAAWTLPARIIAEARKKL